MTRVILLQPMRDLIKDLQEGYTVDRVSGTRSDQASRANRALFPPAAHAGPVDQHVDPQTGAPAPPSAAFPHAVSQEHEAQLREADRLANVADRAGVGPYPGDYAAADEGTLRVVEISHDAIASELIKHSFVAPYVEPTVYRTDPQTSRGYFGGVDQRTGVVNPLTGRAESQPVPVETVAARTKRS